MKLHTAQPNPGWGNICCYCRHTFDDEDKYIEYSPPYPCKQLKYDPGGYDTSVSPTLYYTPAPIFELKRFKDGSEECPSFKPK